MIEQLFQKRKPQEQIGFNFAALLKRRVVKGDIGLEIEMEGNKFPKETVVPPWSYHKDGSLRGKDNAEYVLIKPILFSEVRPAVEALFQQLHDFGTVLDDTNRTSVHVHLNAQRFHMNRLAAFLALYFSVEDILTEWCGEHRVGNLFCLRARDASGIVSQIKKFIMHDGKYDLRDNLHYAGMNAYALYKFGSLEIRTMRGVNDPETILRWVNILERIYNLSGDFPDPRTIPSMLSSEGPAGYLDFVLGDNSSAVKHNISFGPEQIRSSLYDGIRLAQDLCYCRNWDEFRPIDTAADPFGRAVKVNPTTAVGGMHPISMEEFLNHQAMNDFVNVTTTQTSAPQMLTTAQILEGIHQNTTAQVPGHPQMIPPGDFLQNPVMPGPGTYEEHPEEEEPDHEPEYDEDEEGF